MLPDRVLEEAPPPPRDDAGDDPLGRQVLELPPRDAVDLCARQLGRTVGRLCMGLLGSHAEADEAAQETFLAVALAIGQYRGEGTVRAWVLSIARRTCARRLETRTRLSGRLALVVDARPEHAWPDEDVDARRRGHRVRQALEQLRPSEREVLLLRYESGLGFKEVAQACGVDEATARKRASRALDRLRKLLPIEDVR